MNNRCLLCTRTATTASCSSCRKIDRSTIFRTLLTLVSKASTANNYYDLIKNICQQIETVSLMRRC